MILLKRMDSATIKILKIYIDLVFLMGVLIILQ